MSAHIHCNVAIGKAGGEELGKIDSLLIGTHPLM
jgi:hypothetical protein